VRKRCEKTKNESESESWRKRPIIKKDKGHGHRQILGKRPGTEVKRKGNERQ